MVYALDMKDSLNSNMSKYQIANKVAFLRKNLEKNN